MLWHTKIALFRFLPVKLRGLLTKKQGLSLAAVFPGFFQSLFSYFKTLLDGFFSFEGISRDEIVESGMKSFVVIFVDVGPRRFSWLPQFPPCLSPDCQVEIRWLLSQEIGWLPSVKFYPDSEIRRQKINKPSFLLDFR